MIVLDTNVISEIMRPVPDEGVMAWLAAQDPLDLATTSIIIAEIQRGIGFLRFRGASRRARLEAPGFPAAGQGDSCWPDDWGFA